MSKTISIVIISYKRPKSLYKCLDHLWAAISVFGDDNVEILVGINGQDSETQQVTDSFSGIKKFWYKKRRTPAEIRNDLLKETTGQWIYFLDDDAWVTPRTFPGFLETVLNHPEVHVIGGPNLTPETSTFFQEVSGRVLASPLATSISASRYSRRGEVRPCGEESLILCNLFVKAEVLQCRPFLDQLVCAEENWLLQGLKRRGCKMMYSPEVAVWHERRSTVKSFFQQIFKYGFGRGQIAKRAPRSTKLIYFIPSVCVLYSFLVFTGLAFSKDISLWILLPFIIYAVCLLSGVIEILRPTKCLRTSVLALGLFPITHISYGFGLLFGLVAG